MSSVGIRIKQLRKSLDLTQKDFGARIGVKGNTIAQYEIGRNDPLDSIISLICREFGVNESWLRDGVGEMYTLNAKNEFDALADKFNLSRGERIFLEKYLHLNKIERDSVFEFIRDLSAEINAASEDNETTAFRMVRYCQRLASAGSGEIIFDDLPSDLIKIPDIPEYRRVSYAIGVNGHSMEPLYYDGDTLLIEPTYSIDIGEIGIFILGNKSYVKKLGRTELISLNPLYDNVPITEDVKCMGRVVGKL